MDGLELFTVDECRATVCDVPNLIILTIEQGDQEVEIDDSDIPF
jgi:hypothetical protein